jgi:hypothetical protein
MINYCKAEKSLSKNKFTYNFDSSLSPLHSNNRKAAEERGLKYNPNKLSFVDNEGSLVLDRFGQAY